MKKLLVGLLALTSVSAFSFDDLDQCLRGVEAKEVKGYLSYHHYGQKYDEQSVTGGRLIVKVNGRIETNCKVTDATSVDVQFDTPKDYNEYMLEIEFLTNALPSIPYMAFYKGKLRGIGVNEPGTEVISRKLSEAEMSKLGYRHIVILRKYIRD